MCSVLFSFFCLWISTADVSGATNCRYASALLSYTFSHRARVIPHFEPFIKTPEEDLLDILLLPLNITNDRYFSSDEVSTHIDTSGRFHADGARVGEMPFCDLFLVPGNLSFHPLYLLLDLSYLTRFFMILHVKTFNLIKTYKI